VRAARADKRLRRRGERYAEAIAVACALGLRISEIEQMAAAWVDWPARLVTIPMEVSKSNRDDPIPVPRSPREGETGPRKIAARRRKRVTGIEPATFSLGS